MSKAVPHCSCKEGKLPQRPVNLYPTKVKMFQGLEVCEFCNHAVVFLRHNQPVYIVKREQSEITKYLEADCTIKKYISEEGKERGTYEEYYETRDSDR